MRDESGELRGIARRSTDVDSRDASRSRLRAQGIRTRGMIVTAATKLLLAGGGLGFTLRGVAREAKISVSNLQYYFPDRDALLRSVMAPIINGYLAELERAVNPNVPAREALESLLDRQMEVLRDPKATSLWAQFAALASIDPECGRLFDEWYDACVRGIAQLVNRINPDFGPSGSVQFAMLLIAMADGLSYVMRGKRSYTRNLEQSFRATVDFLLRRSPLLSAGKRPDKA